MELAGFGQPFLSPEIFIKGVTDDASECLANVRFVELLDIHHRSVILSAEPLAALPHFRSADVATIATGRFAPCAIVLPQAVFKEGL